MLKLILSIAIYLCIPIGSFILPLVLERSFLMEYSLFSDYLITPIWIVCGLVTVGSVIAYAELYQRIVDMLDKYDIRGIHYDRWNSSQLVNNLVEKNAPMIPFGQGFRSMAAPTKEFERLALRGDIKHFNNPVFNWMLQNVQIERNPEDQIKISKRKSREKIDGVAALVNAIGAWLIVESKNEDNNLPDNYEINLG